MFGFDNLLIDAGWCSVFHQSTENFTIGKLIDPRRTNIAEIFSLTILFSKERLIKIIIKSVFGWQIKLELKKV